MQPQSHAPPHPPPLYPVETLRQLLLQDLDEDGCSHDSDDTPTNETSPLDGERQRPESLETVLKFSTEEWDTEPDDAHTSEAEQPPLQVIRKGSNPSETNCLFYLFLEYFCVLTLSSLCFFFILILLQLPEDNFFSDIVFYLFENVNSFLINSLTKYFPQVYFIF